MLACACLQTAATQSLANDLADEADLQFQIGAERYREGDYLGALEHFLASNRLVPNRNATFNVARCYDQLRRYPEAYRYYSQALEGETVATARERILAALDNIKPHVAILNIVTDPPGATIYVDRRDLGPRGTSPRTLGLAPGSYRVIADKPGFEPAFSAEVQLKAADTTDLTLKLVPQVENLTGSVVINSDEAGALIEIDNRPRAFTPAILTLPSGRHKVRVSLRGFRTVVDYVDVLPNGERRLDLSLIQSDEVTAASRVSEAIEHAPSSVSVLRSEELRGMAYPTLAEALRGVRGVYVWDDRNYTALGFRGVGRLGSYSNRALVLLDGQPTNDNWLGSSYTGYDQRTDLEDIERIEVVRGPGSVLYGTNAFSGVINLVTRGVGAASSREVGISTNEYGVARARARYNVRISEKTSVWTSVSAARGEGRDFYFPELASTPEGGHARGLDGFEAGTLNGRFTSGAFTAQWLLHSRDKHSPTAAYSTIFGDSRFHQNDTRGLVEARFEPVVADGVQLMSRAHYNVYALRGEYPRSAPSGLEGDRYDGRWFGLEQRIALTMGRAVRLTAGGEAQFHHRVHLREEQNGQALIVDDKPYDVQAGYLLTDLDVGRRLRLSGGIRLDHYSTFGSSMNPRMTIIAEPYESGNLKVMVGKAFRAPSIYELHYYDNETQLPNPELLPESIYSGEIELTHRFSSVVTATVSTFVNYVTNLIVQRSVGSDNFRYENSYAPQFAMGLEAEVRREWRRGWMLAASYSAQTSRYLPDHATFEDILRGRSNPGLRHVANSPEHMGSIKASAPLFGHGLLASTRLTVEGPRWDRYEQAIDTNGQSRTDPAVLWDVVLTGEEPRWGVRYAFGVYNAFDWRYYAPVSIEYPQTTILQNGRTFLASMSVSF